MNCFIKVSILHEMLAHDIQLLMTSLLLECNQHISITTKSPLFIVKRNSLITQIKFGGKNTLISLCISIVLDFSKWVLKFEVKQQRSFK